MGVLPGRTEGLASFHSLNVGHDSGSLFALMMKFILPALACLSLNACFNFGCRLGAHEYRCPPHQEPFCELCAEQGGKP